MDAGTASHLQELVRKEGRSLLQYVNESFPWTTAKTDHILPKLNEMAKEEQEGAAAVVRLLLKHRHRPPYLGAYPMSFTNINFIDLTYLLPFLVDFEKRRLADLESDLPHLHDGDAKGLVQSLVEMKRRHLETLTETAGK